MRELNTHLAAAENSSLKILVVDEAGAGGANHRYDIVGFDVGMNTSRFDEEGIEIGFNRLPILFQNGVIGADGMNGVTIEVLLAIAKDRLEGFQAGPYACSENGQAVVSIDTALRTLQLRTLRRIAAQLEGTEAEEPSALAVTLDEALTA